ncbi:MAG: glycosyltransferase family 2 protein [Fimbriimonadaceae bacterium]|nr:glycosyltransferase family 2 protein [Fimbriimonadaceae bacterium]QYK59735.1 MAG: glycosyltransferase family 2 protein [Fimbriimonadaceae bacterium]
MFFTLSRPSIAVIVPAYNEEARILPTLERMAEYLSASNRDWCLTVVSDGSTDATERLVSEMAERAPAVRLIAYSPNRGKGCAVRTGILAAETDLILFSDADLATPVEELDKLEAALEGHDIAIGSRPLRESRLEVRQPIHREMLGRLFNLAVQALAVRGIHDTQCGFKLFRREAARDVFSRCTLDGFGFDFEALMIARDIGYRIAEVPVRWRHQEGSKVVLMRDGPRMIAELVMLRMRGKRRRLAMRAS